MLPIPPQPIMWFRGGYEDGRRARLAAVQGRLDRAVALRPLRDLHAGHPALDHGPGPGADRVQLPGQAADSQIAARRPADAGRRRQRQLLPERHLQQHHRRRAARIREARRTARPSSGWTPGTASTANARTCSSRRSSYFLDNPDAGDSPNGTVVSTPPKADYSLVGRDEQPRPAWTHVTTEPSACASCGCHRVCACTCAAPAPGPGEPTSRRCRCSRRSW